MARQNRVLLRDDPPSACFLVDELSLYRLVGSAEVMAVQCRHLAEVASMARVIVQVLPAVAHPVNASGFLMADDAVWIEHAACGYVFTDEETIPAMAHRFDILRAESYRASESLALLQEMQDRWATGVSPLTAMRTAATA
jgi:predicted transcriptional regulator